MLDRYGVEYVVIGGIAAIAQGYPLNTQDLDITPARDPENIERLTNALRELDAKLRTPREPVEFPVDARMLAGADAWALETNAGDLDLVFMPPGTRGFDDLKQHAVRIDLGTGREALVASLLDLIRMKEASAREKDRAQLPALRRTLEIVRERERDSR